MSQTGGESLGQYVKRVMEEKRLTMHDVEELSEGGITDAYVGNIINGKVKSPSAMKLKALARGLGVSAVELFRIAAGLEGDEAHLASRETWSVARLLRAAEKIVKSEPLTGITQALLEMSVQDVEAVQKFVKSRQKKKPNGKKGK